MKRPSWMALAAILISNVDSYAVTDVITLYCVYVCCDCFCRSPLFRYGNTTAAATSTTTRQLHALTAGSVARSVYENMHTLSTLDLIAALMNW